MNNISYHSSVRSAPSNHGPPPTQPPVSQAMYRCATCKLEFGSYKEAAAHAQTHSQPRPYSQAHTRQLYNQVPQIKEAQTNVQKSTTTATYPPYPRDGVGYQQQQTMVNDPRAPTMGHFANPHTPHQKYGYANLLSPRYDRTFEAPYHQGPSFPPTTVSSTTRRTTHTDGSISVTEETVLSDGSTTTTTRYIAPNPQQNHHQQQPQQQWRPPPLHYAPPYQSMQQYQQQPQPPPANPAMGRESPMISRPSQDYEDIPVAEVEFAELATDGQPFW